MASRCENRELWTVTGIHDDGSLTVSSHAGSGAVTLPGGYVHEHVRLGYAATEHGNQSDTVTIGVELATAATTRRGLYVGATRGQEQNLILVVTESRDLDEARDVLEGILASDRVDLPATSQRRALAETDRVPARRPPRAEPRCEIPHWFADLRSAVNNELSEAHLRADADAKKLDDLNARLASAEEQLAIAESRLDPHRPHVDAAHGAVQAARERRWSANNAAFRVTGRKRRAARREVEAAGRNYADAEAQLQEVEAVAAPARAERSQAASAVRDIESSISSARILDRWSDAAERAEELRDLAAALDDWRDWASGEPMQLERVAQLVALLEAEGDVHPAACETLATAVEHWAHAAGIRLAPVEQRIETPSRSLDIGIDL